MTTPFTGERFVPGLRGQMYYEHVHRYAIASRFCAGKRVLDLACGEGYGSALLARTALSVVGIDIDRETVERAARTYFDANLEFVRGSADDIPLVDSSVDAVVCFETLEHIEAQAKMLEEFRRVLAPGGLLFISSPNRLVYSDKHGAQNPFHVRELYFDEFRDLLREHFSHVEIYGQRMAVASVVHPLGARRDPDAGWLQARDGGLERGLPALADPEYFFAVCSYGAIPTAVSGAFVDPADDLPVAQPRPHGAPAYDGDPRILLAAAPKSGSTFAADVLARYLDVPLASSSLREMQWEAEQNLHRSLLDQFDDSGWVLQLHMKPYPLFLDLLRERGASVLLQWRNLGDAIVSLDEHLAKYGVDQPVCYVHDGPGFLALPDDARYQYLIRNGIPWFVWFYLAWRKADGTFGVYERMVEDPLEFFASALERLGIVPDRERLARVLDDRAGFTRINAGTVGRSAERFDDDTKRLLEKTLLDDPWSSELEVLLWELPWEVPALQSGGRYDGSVVRGAGKSEEYWFVSRGQRHLLRNARSWLASRISIGRAEIPVLSSRELAKLVEGPPLA